MGKEKTLQVFAILVLLIGIISSLYVYAQETEIETQREQIGKEDTITINNIDYNKEELFEIVESRTITIEEKEITGLALDKLLTYANTEQPSAHKYTFIATDSYQQTVTWDMVQAGIFTDYNRVIFPGTAHSFWVSNIIEIEVK